jgi:ABC-2 type transport system permease protein
LPDAVLNLSPLSHPAQLPAEPFAVAPVVVLLAVAAVGIAGGITGFSRRQLPG